LKNRPNILVCPLDWGIGHATRCVPLVRELSRSGTNVIIGASGRSMAFLRHEFPELEFIEFPGYVFNYPRRGSMTLKMLFQLPAFLSGIKREHRMLEKFIDDHNINAVISDNRFGLWTKRIPCIFMTHQVFIRSSKGLNFLEPILFRLNSKYLMKYNEVWIPDFDGKENLSGDLSHLQPLAGNYFFIGPQSRFYGMQNEKKPEIKYDLLVLLSGPEPQRTMLYEKIAGQLAEADIKAVIVEGKPEKMKIKKLSNKVTVFSHLETEKLFQLLLESELIISRPGYSTIMDLAVLGKKAVFIPTPGQTEQEYLAEKFKQEKVYFSISQKQFDLNKVMEKVSDYQGLQRVFDERLLQERVKTLLDKL
jgi:UDP:flavonoid glycosyltransferase YjiC (YdhE family)